MKLRLAGWLAATTFLLGAANAQQMHPEVQSQPNAMTARLSDPGSPAGGQKSRSSAASASGTPVKHKIGPLDITVDWRTRAEGWNWFQGNTGNSDYPFWHSLLRVGIGQTFEHFDWYVEGAQASILGLPNDAVVAAPQGQLGLGATYYAANNNHTSTASGFVRQGFINLKHLGPAGLKLGRFDYIDASEVNPRDSLLGTVVRARISNRLISNFGFSAVQRSFDGAQLSINSGHNNFSFLAARPTEGVFQVKGMNELNVDVYSGVYTRSLSSPRNAGQLRVFAMGYVDHRTLVLKTDNRPQAVRAADHGKIEIGTYGADYADVYHSEYMGTFDVVLWGAVQTGAWGNLTQHAGSFVAETGWQPPISVLKPWISIGYSYGNGDKNPSDSRHGTFFQLLPTPRAYARFPFYNMMNNEDVYGTVSVKPASKLALRSELHALRLASASDFWYLGGGAFQSNTFGYTGRPSSGNRGLANVCDVSADYQLTRSLSTTVYYGHAFGKGVIASIYPKDANGQFAYLETNFHF